MSDAADARPAVAERARLARGRRARLLVVLVALVGCGLALLASTQPWFVLELVARARHPEPLAVQGSTASPALAPLGVAGLAFAGALTIAGRGIRGVLAVLGILVGGSLILAATSALGSPVTSARGSVTDTTGISGARSVAALVARVDVSVWPVVAIVGGAIVVLAAIGVLATSRRWPGASHRYRTVRPGAVLEETDGATADGGATAGGGGTDGGPGASDDGVPGVPDGSVEPDPDAVGVEPDGAREPGASGDDGAPEADLPVDDDAATSGGGTHLPEAARPPASTPRDAAVDAWDDLTRGDDPTR